MHSQSCSVLLKELARVRCLPRFLSVQVWSCCAFKKLFRCVLQLQLLVRSHKFRGTSRAAFAHYRSCSDVHQVQLSSAAPSVLWFLSVCSSAAEDAAVAPLSCSDVESLDGTLLVSPVNLTRYTQAAFYPQSYPQGHPLAYLTPAIAGRYLRSPLSYPQAIGAGRHTGLELRLYSKLYDMNFGGQLAARLEPLVVWMSVSCGQLRKLAAPCFLSAKIK